MEPDFKSLIKRIVEQIDFDYDAGENISEELWELKVEAKQNLQYEETNNSKVQKRKPKTGVR